MGFYQKRQLIPFRAARFLGIFLCLGLLAQGGNTAQILFVADHDDINDLDGNDSVVDRLETLGHTVTPVVDDDAMFTDPSGSDLIVISSSVLSSNVGFHFTDEPIPVIHWEEALWDEYLMSDAGGRGVDGDSIEVVDTSHRLASWMGLTTVGELVVRDIPTLFHVGNQSNLAPGAAVIAEEAGGGSPMIAVVDAGGELNDGSLAPAIRIAMFFGDVALDGVNDTGISIFDAAVNYALGIGGAPRLQAGDADMDLDFDQLDLVQVQIAAKYLTGQSATWGQGDWDGAPGGEPGNPPSGNGVFDQIDIIAALSAGTYLNGPYAAVGTGGTHADEQTPTTFSIIPEPSPLALAVLGVMGLLVARRRQIGRKPNVWS